MPDPTDADTNAAIWKSEEVARTFAAQSEQRDRSAREQLTLVARLLPFGPDDAFTFLDLGAGTGAASRAVLAEYPRANADPGRVLAADGGRGRPRHDRLRRPLPLRRVRHARAGLVAALVPAPLDAIVSALSIHHLPDDRKRTIFGEICAHLRPGGWYVNYDPIRAPDDTLEAIWERVNDRYDPEAPHKRAHRTDRSRRGTRTTCAT